MSLKAQIEAILFVTSKPIKALAIARIVNADVQDVRQALLELVHDYEERKGGLEIADEDGYSFQVKDQYASLMDEFMPVEMSAALIRTLSAIAIKQPILQSDIIRIRGAGAYEHIRDLVIKDLVCKKEESGERSPALSTTKKFQDYFRLTKEGKDLRNYLKKEVKKANAAEAAGAGQLVIPSVVSPEADDQLNTGIYLETADFDKAEHSLEGQGDFSPAGVGYGGDDSVTQVQSTQNVVAAADVQVSAAVDLETFPPPPMVEQIMIDESAATTLSKLAAAASIRQPEPLPDVEPAETIPGGVTPEESEGRKRSAQASMVSRKEPSMGTAKKKKPVPDQLDELLRKQKLLELELKDTLVNRIKPDIEVSERQVGGKQNPIPPTLRPSDLGNSV